MPAYIPALDAAGIKWVSGFPGNKNRGLPYISGLLILNDAATGMPLAVMDCGWITGVRTGAATAIAARYLARPDSATVGILACGVQGRTNLAALNVLFPLERVRAYDTDRATAEAFAREMSALHDLEVVVVVGPREAVAGCDMVVTSGPILRHPHATIRPGWLDEGAFASLVDFDSYWHPEALAEAEKLCTDDMDQFLYYKSEGYFQKTPEVYAELGELITGRKPGRESNRERTVAMNLGLAMDDMAVAPLIYRKALEMDLGTWLPR
jgi:ornithine cyclodeaminase/alanine dehydrogenase